MTYEDAVEWLKGKRSMCNTFEEPVSAEVDASLTQQAYWIVKAHKEGLV